MARADGGLADDALSRGAGFWEESARWRCDGEWKEAYVELMKSDPRNTTKWKRAVWERATYWEPPFARLLGGSKFPKIKACKWITGCLSVTKGLETARHELLGLKPPSKPAAEPWCVGSLTDEYRRLEILGDSGGQGWRAHEGSEEDR